MRPRDKVVSGPGHVIDCGHARSVAVEPPLRHVARCPDTSQTRLCPLLCRGPAQVAAGQSQARKPQFPRGPRPIGMAIASFPLTSVLRVTMGATSPALSSNRRCHEHRGVFLIECGSIEATQPLAIGVQRGKVGARAEGSNRKTCEEPIWTALGECGAVRPPRFPLPAHVSRDFCARRRTQTVSELRTGSGARPRRHCLHSTPVHLLAN